MVQKNNGKAKALAMFIWGFLLADICKVLRINVKSISYVWASISVFSSVVSEN